MSPEDKQLYLGEFEELVLLAILRLDDNAYGVSIRQIIESETGRSTSIGAVYTTLERLQGKGYIRSRQGEATPERGGKAKRYYVVDGAGAEALERAIAVRRKMMAGIRVDWLPLPT